MKKHIGLTALLLICLLAGSFGAAAAQTPEPPAPEEDTGEELFTHPVLALLSAYFGREANDDGTLPDEDDEDIPGEEDDDLTVGEEIAAFHEDGIGFGVLVKLYAMAEASKAACDAENNASGGTPAEGEETEACVPVTAAELVAAFKGGSGMGQLFKQYGKPALLGVGHVRKALNNSETPVIEQGKPDKAKKDKVKGPKNKK